MNFSLKVLEFKTDYKMNEETGKRDRPVHWVLLTNLSKHGRSETWHRVRDLQPKDFDADSAGGRASDVQKFFEARWKVIQPHYDNWLKGRDMTIDGTPLNTWPALSADEVRVLNGAGVHTVEAVSQLSEGLLGRIPLPNMRETKKAAAKFLDNADTVSLMNRIEQLEALLAATSGDETEDEEPVLEADTVEQLAGEDAPAPIPEEPAPKPKRRRRRAA